MDPERHEEIARGLFRESNDALFQFDTNHNRVIDLNPVALRLTGFTREQARRLSVWDLFSEEGEGALVRLIDAYHRTGFYHSREGFFLHRKDRSTIPVNVSVSRIHTKPTPIGLVVARDVTDRKKSEAALRASEARYRRLIETAPVVFWTLDHEGRITSLNPEFTMVTGHEINAWIGRPFPDLVIPQDRAAAETMIRQAPSSDSSHAVELRVPGLQGEIVVLEFLTCNPLGLDPGEGISGIARNVTEARRAETLEREKIAAELADQAKTKFLARFSHEIRTPLTSILGFTDILLNDNDVANLPSERLNDLQLIRQSGRHLLGIINDILDLARIEAGKLTIDLKPVSPREAAYDVRNALLMAAEAKGLQLQVIVDESVPSIMATDPARLRQVLTNLVSNAIKFTRKGQIHIRVFVESTEPQGKKLAFAIQDTGVGLSREQQSHLFEPFYRVADGDEGGTGLGLVISRHLAERLGGTLTVTSRPGAGSTFRLLVPIIAKEETDSDAPPSSAPLSIGPHLGESQITRLDGRILLAEDNSSIQRVITLQLEKAGARVNVARNGQEAIDLAAAASLAEQPFDVVLMDMQMPVVDGYEATRQLRAQGFSGRIIALTAYAMAEDRQECLRLGCDDHLSKPIDWIQLNQRLAQFLSAND